MRIKILQYNILNGLCCERKPYIVDKERKEAFFDAIEKENPDILTLCEASCRPFVRKSNNFEDTIEEMLQTSDNCNKFRGTPAIISKFDIEFRNKSEHFRKLISASIYSGEKKINLEVVHPRPELDEVLRNHFFSNVIKNSQNPYILSGDFNSLSPEDHYDSERLTKGYQRFMGEHNGRMKVEDIIKAYAMQPFGTGRLTDTYKLIRRNGDFTVPTDWRNVNKDSAVRLDYIFCSKDFKIIDAGIIKNDMTEKASDHYPTYAVLEI